MVQNDPSDSDASYSDCGARTCSGEGVDVTSGWLLIARGLLEVASAERNGGFECSVSGAGADDDRLKLRAVMGASNRVTISGTWWRSNSAMAASSSAPFLPSTSSSAIFSQRLRSLGPTSRTLRFSVALPFAWHGRKAYWGNLRLCSSSAILALECQIWRSSCGRFCQVSPMILESVLWFVSTSDETCWFLMNEERKRMNAFGGRGMWFSGFFFAWPTRREGEGKSVAGGGKSIPSAGGSCGDGGSRYVSGVTAVANAMAWLPTESIDSDRLSGAPANRTWISMGVVRRASGDGGGGGLTVRCPLLRISRALGRHVTGICRRLEGELIGEEGWGVAKRDMAW